MTQNNWRSLLEKTADTNSTGGCIFKKPDKFHIGAIMQCGHDAEQDAASMLTKIIGLNHPMRRRIYHRKDTDVEVNASSSPYLKHQKLMPGELKSAKEHYCIIYIEGVDEADNTPSFFYGCTRLDFLTLAHTKINESSGLEVEKLISPILCGVLPREGIPNIWAFFKETYGVEFDGCSYSRLQ